MPTIREIASHAGVSKSTVSLVLNEKPGVASKTRRLVLNALHALEQNEAETIAMSGGGNIARVSRLAPEQSKASLSIMLLHPWWFSSKGYFQEILRGIQKSADDLGVQLRLADLHHERAQDIEKHIYFTDPQLRPDGVLLLETQQVDSFISVLEEHDIPCVLAGAPTYRKSIKVVAPDETQAGYLAAQHLLELGHRNIVFISDNDEFKYVQDRIYGFTKAMLESGINISSDWIYITGFNSKIDPEYFSDHSELTAVIIANEATSEIVLPHLKLLNKRMPEDISVVTFDDFDFARYHQPTLTAISYPLYEQGYWALQMLFNRIREPTLNHFQLTFEAKLVKRKSCKALS